jgi:two-component system nitrogen regulation response regulator GlnG
VPALARFFLQKSAKDLGIEAKRITEPALARLMKFDFPGNVRQLENICHWLTVMAPAQVIEAKDLPPELLADGAAAALPSMTPEGDAAHDVATQPVPVQSPASTLLAGQPVSATPAVSTPAPWLLDLERESRSLLQSGAPEVWETLTRKFEAQLIHTALEVTRGRRIEAAQKLGIGRNTITRKIQELGLDD